MFVLAWLQDLIHERCTLRMIDHLVTYRAQNLVRSQKGSAQTPADVCLPTSHLHVWAVYVGVLASRTFLRSSNGYAHTPPC